MTGQLRTAHDKARTRILKNTLPHYLFLALGGGLIIALDQWSKALVRSHLALGERWAPWEWLLPYARIVHWTNRGAAFGMFQNGSLFFTALAFLVAGLIAYYFPRVVWQDWPLKIAMMMQFGGAVGNLVDRLLRGYVTDFISVGNFAVFNLADSSIFLGAVVLVLGLWRGEQHTHQADSGGGETIPLGEESLPEGSGSAPDG